MASDLENWSLDKWLKKLGLRGKYRQAFIDNGYDTPDLCADLNKEDLDAIGVSNKHHRSTLFTQSRKLLELVEKDNELTSSGVVTEAPASTLPVPAGNTSNTAHTNNGIPVSGSSSSTELLLSDYSEPWNGGSNDPVPISPIPKSPLHKIKISTDSTDGPGNSRKGGSGQLISKSLGTDLLAYKKTPTTSGSTPTTGLTRLQLKLKIREELFTRGVVLSESPYCMEDGSPDEQLVIDLADELANRFEVESLEMYSTLQEVWSYANKTDYATAKVNKTVMFELKRKGSKKPTDQLHVQSVPSNNPPGTDNYDEPFDSTSGLTQKHSPIKKVQSTPSKESSTDNYDEPFDSTSGLQVTPRHSPTKMKSATLPSNQPSDGCYDEPFDSVPPKTSPEKVKRESQTLPSPRRQRKSIDSASGKGSRSPKSSPKGSPGPPPPSFSRKTRFNIFKRKEKARSQSVRDHDVRFLEEDSKTGKKLAIISFPLETRHASAENVSSVGVSLDALQLEHLKNGIPPPLPSPRKKSITKTPSKDEDSLGSDQPSKGYKKFITPPTLQRHHKHQFDYNSTSSSSSENSTPKFGNKISSKSTVEIDRLSNSSNDEYEGKAWMRASKSYNELRDIDTTSKSRSLAKKGKTSRFIARIFKRKSMTPATMKKDGKSKTLYPSHRGSGVSNSPSISESRERSLTASISMPDITKILEKRALKASATPPDRHDSGYAEVFDAIKSNYTLTANFQATDQPKKIEKSPPKPISHKPPWSSSQDAQVSSSSPPRTSPVTISHRQMHIRGVSESSAPDHITISIKSGTSGLEFIESANLMSASLDSKPVDSLSTVSDGSNFEDPLSPNGTTGCVVTSSGGGGSRKSQTGNASSDRSGSIGSNTSSEISVGSLTKKPPTLPKPHLLSNNVKVKSSNSFSSSNHTKKNATIPSTAEKDPSNNNAATTTITTTKLNPSKPPPKPSRSPSRKMTGSAGSSRTSTTSTVAAASDKINSTTTGSLKSHPASTSGIKPPPPKPSRHVHSDNISGTNNTLSSPPPSSLVKVVEEVRKPPPKPSRRGRSIKSVSIGEESSSKTLDRSSRLSVDDVLLSSPHEGYTNATLPHHFKVIDNAGSGSPKPVPKPRTSLGAKSPKPVTN